MSMCQFWDLKKFKVFQQLEDATDDTEVKREGDSFGFLYNAKFFKSLKVQWSA